MKLKRQSWWEIFRHPVALETRRELQKIWNGINLEYRTDWQMLGRHQEGCGATIGVMPRCDFDCTGCYLGRDADFARPLSVAEIKQQITLLRSRLGDGGNLQVTDGEVTLRPVAELIEILRFVREKGLVPMVMTHGDVFRRRPQLLKRLVMEGGLTEVCFHIDITQKGRTGAPYRNAESEIVLNPLRAEFAALVRQIRAETGVRLRVATTLTVTSGNVHEMKDVVAWLLRNSDVFRIISFQPVAQVGRTVAGIGPVETSTLWAQIQLGLFGDTGTVAAIEEAQWWMGHPACNRFVMGFVVRRNGEQPRYYPVSARENWPERKFLHRFYDRWGGVSFRDDTSTQATARVLGMLLQSPLLFFKDLSKMLWIYLNRVSCRRPWRTLWEIITGRTKVSYLTIVSHHFMDREELETSEGQERVAHCVFHVPVNGELVSMCEVNANGIRGRAYRQSSVVREERLKVNATA